MSTSPRKRPASDAILAGGGVALLIAIVGVVLWKPEWGNALYPPEPVTREAQAISNLYNIVFAIAVVIFVAVEGLIVWSILRYRRRPTDVDLPPQTHGNNLVEVLWTLIPTVIVLYMFAISWDTLNTVDAVSPDPDIRVHAIAGQFQWQFEYLDKDGNHIATQRKPSGEGGGMAVPVGVKVQVSLTSADVIHAWYVPHFLFKRDVVPGQINHFEFTVDPGEAGQTFHGQCAELCGTNHRSMTFSVVAMTDADFQAFLDKLVAIENATPAPAPSGATVLQLTAKTIAYDKQALEAPADKPFAIEFKNEDTAGVTHDVDIHSADGSSVIANQDPIDGGKTATYSYEPLPAGTYQFFCSVHPNYAPMTGTLTVK